MIERVASKKYIQKKLSIVGTSSMYRGQYICECVTNCVGALTTTTMIKGALFTFSLLELRSTKGAVSTTRPVSSI